MLTCSTLLTNAVLRMASLKFVAWFGLFASIFDTALQRSCDAAESCWPGMSKAPLAGILQEAIQHGNEAALDTWQEKRLEIAHSVVAVTDGMMKVATVSSPAVKTLRSAVIGIIGRIPFAEHGFAKNSPS